jgi:hypothetical protein
VREGTVTYSFVFESFLCVKNRFSKVFAPEYHLMSLIWQSEKAQRIKINTG